MINPLTPYKMSTSKINLEINGLTFTLPNECLRKTTWNGEPITPYIYLRAKHVASLIKQYVKIKYPQIECSAKSEVYSGGDSVNVYLSTPNGYEVSEEICSDVNRFGNIFEEGRFDGMTDMYEYNDSTNTTDNGTRIDGGSKYVFVNNRAQFGTVADVCRMLRDYQAGNYIGGVRDLAGSIKEILKYGIPQKNVDKALGLI
jgi:hypothetical protein